MGDEHDTFFQQLPFDLPLPDFTTFERSFASEFSQTLSDMNEEPEKMVGCHDGNEPVASADTWNGNGNEPVASADIGNGNEPVASADTWNGNGNEPVASADIGNGNGNEPVASADIGNGNEPVALANIGNGNELVTKKKTYNVKPKRSHDEIAQCVK